MENTHWVNLQENLEIDISSQTHPKEVRVVLPSLSFPNACKVFESLSKIVKTFQNKSAIFILSLSGDEAHDRHLKELFQKDTEHEQKGILIYSAEIIFWDSLSFSKNCASLLATQILKFAIEEEKKIDTPALINSTSRRIKEGFNEWEKGLSGLILSAGEMVSWLSLVWNFGFGRREGGYIRLATLMNPDSLNNENVQAVFSFPPLPESGFIIDIFQEFEHNIKTFYCPDFDISPFDITKTYSLEEEGSLPELPFNSVFWVNAISHINNNLNQVLQMLRTAHRNQRRQVLRDVSQQLSDIRSRMHLEVEQEINHLRSLNDLLELHPKRAKTAYERVYADIFSVIIMIFPHLWRLRGLPLWIPSLIYPLRAPIRYAVGILRETLRLLLFYRACYHVLLHFRKTIKEYLERFINLKKELPGYKKHIENLEQELNIIRSPLPVAPIKKGNLELRTAPDRFPEYDDILGVLEDDLKALCTELIEAIKTMRKSNGFNPRRIIAELLPTIHKKEAWLAAQDITEAFQEWKPFQKALSSMLSRAQIDPNTNVVFYRKRSKKVVSVLDEELFLEWKRRALRERPGQFRFDILTPHIKDEESATDFILKNASKLGFLESDGTDEWVSKRWFKFIPGSIRYIFFQRKTGLTQIEIKQKADSSQKKELRNWFNWFFYGERDKDCSGFNSKTDKAIWEEDIVDTIFSFLDDYFCTDPISHCYYGKLELGEEELRFILKDTLSKPLMKLFAPDEIDNCEPRRFPNKDYITRTLSLNGLKDVIYVLLNIAIYEKKDVSKFKRFFNSH